MRQTSAPAPGRRVRTCCCTLEARGRATTGSPDGPRSSRRLTRAGAGSTLRTRPGSWSVGAAVAAINRNASPRGRTPGSPPQIWAGWQSRGSQCNCSRRTGMMRPAECEPPGGTALVVHNQYAAGQQGSCDNTLCRSNITAHSNLPLLDGWDMVLGLAGRGGNQVARQRTRRRRRGLPITRQTQAPGPVPDERDG